MVDWNALVAAAADNHPLKNAPQSYIIGFAKAANAVYSENRIEAILQEKFGIPNYSAFSLDRYLQSASELSVQHHLLQQQSARNVQIERKVHPPKDVDAYYEVKDVRVSLEVKCAVEAETASGSTEIRTAGRVPDYRGRYEEIEALLRSADANAKTSLGKNKDNTLKDFLLSAHSKFRPDSGLDDLNLLLVACDSPYNMNCWYSYLRGEGGFFTASRICPPSEFELVDVVVLSSLKYAHTKGRQSHDWSLRDVLLLPICNPAARKSCMSSTIIAGLSVFDHHMASFGHYTRTASSDVPEYIRDAVKVNGFVAEALSEVDRARFFLPE
jgi:hypothetical protein